MKNLLYRLFEHENLTDVFHGIESDIRVSEDEVLFRNMGGVIRAGRYHSWIVSRDDFPAELKVTATDSESRIMAIAHSTYDVRGVQFHPESVLTPQGETILKNWLES